MAWFSLGGNVRETEFIKTSRVSVLWNSESKQDESKKQEVFSKTW